MRKFKLAKFKTDTTSKIVHFETAPLSAEFTEANGAIYTSGLVLVEGAHTDSKQRPHVFSAERVKRIVENTNKLLQQGARLPLLTDHQKTQDTTIGDVEGLLEARVITADDIKDPKYTNLIGKFGAFANQIAIKASKAVNQYKDRLLSTVSPGIDIVSDSIREISCTSTPAIVGLSLFKGYDNEATFALTFDDLEQQGDQIDQIKVQYDSETEKLWVVLTSILTADEEALGDQDQSELIEKALDDFENRVLEVLGVTPDEQEPEEPETPEQEDVQAQQAGSKMPRTLSQRTGTTNYSDSDLPEIVAAFTLDDMEKLAQFGLGSTALGIAKKAGRAVGNIKRQGILNTVAKEAGGTVGAVKGGFKGAVTAAKNSGKGRLRSNLSGVKGAVRQGLSTTGGKVAAGGLGATAVGTGLALRPRKPKKPKF
jgi:hypothetical protein